MIRTFVDSGVLIEAFRGSSAIATSALAILSDANREFVTSEFVRLEVLPKANLRFFDASTHPLGAESLNVTTDRE